MFLEFFMLNLMVSHLLRMKRNEADNGFLGSVDANRGDLFLGWDTDQFPTDIYETTLAMYRPVRLVPRSHRSYRRICQRSEKCGKNVDRWYF